MKKTFRLKIEIVPISSSTLETISGATEHRLQVDAVVEIMRQRYECS